jgi:tetratricopeptide (TPR) repeat protein
MASRSWPRPPLRRTSFEVSRYRIAAWLEVTAAAPVRVLCAPVGTGKTIAVRRYVEERGRAAAYVRVPTAADAATLRDLIAATDAEEVALDELDRADAAACEALYDDVLDEKATTRLIVVGRSRRHLRIHELLARGLATACDVSAFPFDAEELAELAAGTGLPCDAGDLAQLLADTEGWPLVAHWLMRDALEGKRLLRDAFAQWRENNGHLLFEFLQYERYKDADAFEAFQRMLTEGGADAQHELERLEELGLPIVRERGVLRPYRLLTRLRRPGTTEPEAPASGTVPLMRLNVLGRFRCELGGRPVTFARRRDQHVFVYVAIAPEGRTTREGLLEAFWPGVEHGTASQSLRVTLSRIRRAILSAAPEANPEWYFRTAGNVSVDTRTVAVDVRRFIDHVEQGRLDDDAGNIDGAKHHYRAAHRLYEDRLLASEAPAPCFASRTADFESVYGEVLSRLTALHAALGEIEPAREYASALERLTASLARERPIPLFAVSPSRFTA